MTVKVKVKRVPTKISVKATLNTADAVITLKQDSSSTNYNRLDSLKDVEEGLMPADGSTLVYDQETDKYQVKKLDFGDIDVDLDGGSF
jgi:hypothetical protein